MLASFHDKMLMFGDLINIGGNKIFLQLPQLLIVHRRCESLSMECVEKSRILRFNPNPKIGAGLIMRDCMKISFH